MELRDFVAATLVEIQEGVQKAIEHSKARKTPGAINPSFRTTAPELKELTQKVQFDIAVTVSEKTSGKAEGGIKVVALSLGGAVSDAAESSKVSRIQFAVPIIPPTTPTSDIEF